MNPQQLQEALSHQKMNGGKLGKAFVSLGYVRDEEITSLLSRQYGVPSINLDHFEVDPAIIKIIPAETARKYQILPLSRSGATLTIAMADPTNVFAMDDIKFMTGYNVEPVVASESSLDEAIEKYYGSTRSLELRKDGGGGERGQREGGGFPMLGGSPSLKEVMEGPGLTFDDMASVGLSEVDLDALSDAEADVETVKERGRRDRPRRPQQVRGGRPGRQADERAPHRLAEAGRLRHPRRALREGVPRPVPHRRHPLQRDGPAHEAARPADLAHQDHGQAGHRGEAPAPGRPHQDQDEDRGPEPRPGLPRLLPAHALGREDRPPAARQDEAHAGHDQAGLRAALPGSLQEGDRQAVRDRARDRAHGIRQDQHALLGDRLPQQARHQHHDRGGPRRVQPPGDQPGPDQGQHRAELRGRAPVASCARTRTSSWWGRSATTRRRRSR